MDFPNLRISPPPILTPFHSDMMGSFSYLLSVLGTAMGVAVSAIWPVANKAYFYPFHLDDWATAYQLLFWVGGVSSGNIDVAIYDSQKNRIVSAGSTAMSATVNTVQELNITDTVLPPGDYLLGFACDNITGTCFRVQSALDEIILPDYMIYEETGLTAAALPDPCTPVVCTDTTVALRIAGIQFRSFF